MQRNGTVDLYYNNLNTKHQFLGMQQMSAITYIQEMILQNKTLSFIEQNLSVVTNPRFPRNIKKSLDFLTIDKPLTIVELDSLIKYFVIKRTEHLQEEYGDYIPHHLRYPPVGPHEDPVLKDKKDHLVSSLMETLRENPDAAETTTSSHQPPSSNHPSITETDLDETLMYVRNMNQSSSLSKPSSQVNPSCNQSFNHLMQVNYDNVKSTFMDMMLKML